MLRFFLKKRIIKKQKKKIIKLYLNFKNFFKEYSHFNYNSYVGLTLPKRQLYYTFTDIHNNKTKCFGSGRLLLGMGRKTKFFKRSPKNIMSIILQFKKIYGIFLKYIYLYFINNFNYRQFIFFKKFNDVINPSIYYLLHKQSFMPKFLNKKRIKKRVLKRLLNY